MMQKDFESMYQWHEKVFAPFLEFPYFCLLTTLIVSDLQIMGRLQTPPQILYYLCEKVTAP